MATPAGGVTFTGIRSTAPRGVNRARIVDAKPGEQELGDKEELPTGHLDKNMLAQLTEARAHFVRQKEDRLKSRAQLISAARRLKKVKTEDTTQKNLILAGLVLRYGEQAEQMDIVSAAIDYIDQCLATVELTFGIERMERADVQDRVDEFNGMFATIDKYVEDVRRAIWSSATDSTPEMRAKIVKATADLMKQVNTKEICGKSEK